MLLEFYFILIVIILLSIGFLSSLTTIFNNKTNDGTIITSGNGKKAPSPIFKLPILGHLHLLSGYKVPYQAFSNIGKKYGSVVNLKLGIVNCYIINGTDNIRETLITRGHHFDSRPNFQRYHQLFDGNKENSLAFCNWSKIHKNRRDMLKAHTFPKNFSLNYRKLEDLITEGSNVLNQQLIMNDITNLNNDSIEIKSKILKITANIFTQYFCSKKFNLNDEKFIKMIENYDEIFYEVNQGYAADFIPFLMIFHQKHLKSINKLTNEIRLFMNESIIQQRFNNMNINDEINDYVENLIKSVKFMKNLQWNEALFALEDIVGGHSAVGNFFVKLLAYLVGNPQVQEKIQKEIDQTYTDNITIILSDKNQLKYTYATIFEAIRLIASPIVPRVANQNTTINGYKILKDSVIFLNNYDQSMSDKLWDEPDKFKPERFLQNSNGNLLKPDYFMPFGGGRRSCMGYKMVLSISFGLLSNLMKDFTIEPIQQCNYDVPIGSLALPKDTFKFKFVKRTIK